MTIRQKAFNKINSHVAKRLGSTGLDLHDLPDSPCLMNALDEMEDSEPEDWDSLASDAADEILSNEGFPAY
jgi:hypothetical protein